MKGKKMASKEQRKLQKRKERERAVRQKLLAQQAVTTAKRQTDMAEMREQKAARKEFRAAQNQQKRVKDWADGFVENLSKLPEATRQKILHNLEVLKALEEEYKNEQSARQNVNNELESEGHMSLSEKLTALHTQLSQQQALTEIGKEHSVGHIGGSADYRMEVNEPQPENKESPAFIDKMNDLMKNMITG